jgi:RNA polymerase sigma-70 factor (ECF subfamily)
MAQEKFMHVIDRERTRWFLRNILPHEAALRSWLNRRQPFDLDVDDIVQESYAILADLDRVDDIRHPRAYLFQVTRSVIAKHVRRARVVPIHAFGDLACLDEPDFCPSPEQIVIDRDQLLRLAEAISAMPPKTQQAFVLRRVEGLSQREISARMAISENTVEKHISRGIRFLIEWFGYGGKALANISWQREMESGHFDRRARNQSIH